MLRRPPLISSCTASNSPARKSPRLITMSISSAPSDTACFTSASRSGSGLCPDGNAVATDATLIGRIREPPRRVLDQKWIDAHGSDWRHVRIVARSTSFLAERRDLSGSVLPLERGEIDHGDRGLQTPELGAPS